MDDFQAIEPERLSRKGGQAVPVMHACPLSDSKGDGDGISGIEDGQSQIKHVETSDISCRLDLREQKPSTVRIDAADCGCKSNEGRKRPRERRTTDTVMRDEASDVRCTTNYDNQSALRLPLLRNLKEPDSGWLSLGRKG